MTAATHLTVSPIGSAVSLSDKVAARKARLGAWLQRERELVWAEHHRQAAAAERHYHLCRLQHRVEEALSHYLDEVEHVGVVPRAAGDCAQVPAEQVLGFATAQVARAYAARPARMAVRADLGVWFGMFAHDGRWSLLVERKRRVQRLFTVCSLDEMHATWAVVAQICDTPVDVLCGGD
ncbi:MAG TPA: hypothetical protein P5181_06905 [Dermatophilaceae bacterium]|nr:hypothetical protein [Dermatophilaceae bacterium]